MESLFRKKNESKYFSFDISTKETKIFSNNPITPFVIIFILVLLTLIIPVSWLIYNSISLLHENILILTHFIKASINSILLAFLGGALLTSFAAIICFTQRIYGGSLNLFLNLSKLGYASPGIVIALGVITPIIYFDKKIIQFSEMFKFQ